MKIALFSSQDTEQSFLNNANKDYNYDLVFFNTQLNLQTASLAQEFPTISCFVTDCLNAEVLKILADGRTKFIALRSAGFNNVDTSAAERYGITIARVPAYSPHAVAEFAVGLMLSLNRKIHRAYVRVREHNFSLNGLLGFDLFGKTIGIIGTGKIGEVLCQIMRGFGCNMLGYDPVPNEACTKLGLKYTTLAELYQQSDIISLHCPLNQDTYHLINEATINQMKKGVMIINTGRGALLDTLAVIHGLKSNQVGYLGIDVYEEEENLFFHDLSSAIIQDDVFTRLQAFPNVLITGHQAFFTEEALIHIAQTTLLNVQNFKLGKLKDTLVRS